MINVAYNRNSGQRIFPKGWAPFLVSLFALYAVCSLSRRTILIAPVPEEDGVGWALSIICFGAVGCLFGWMTTQNDRTMLVRGVLGFGIAAAMGAGMLYGPVIEIAQGAIDFPSSSTREYRTLLPVSYAFHREATGKRPDMAWVLLSHYGAEAGINVSDYRLMERALGQHSNRIEIKERFCVAVTLQKSGNSLRIMHVLLGYLPAHSIVACGRSGIRNP